MKFQKILILITFIICIKINAQSTASKQISTFTIEASQLETEKKIWLYLPKDYYDSKEAYPVIYMHDAQNLFDEKTSFVGEWKIDEYLDSLDKNESIIIGIEHGNEKRTDELIPFYNNKYGGGKADEYLNFIINTLKPYIDSGFRTLTDKEHTTIWGSSLGGLISLYAVIKYPETFGNAGIFSPAIWINKNEMFEFVKGSTVEQDKKFYFLVGSEEGETIDDASEMVSDQNKMVDLLLENGVDKTQIINRIIEGGKHNEGMWSTYFPEAYQWLIKN